MNVMARTVGRDAAASVRLARTAISCRKSEIELSLPYEHFRPSFCRRPEAPELALESARQDESVKKKSSSLFPRNLLKSID
jgi:hypothetical protein